MRAHVRPALGNCEKIRCTAHIVQARRVTLVESALEDGRSWADRTATIYGGRIR